MQVEKEEKAGKKAQMNNGTEIPFFQLSSSEQGGGWQPSHCIEDLFSIYQSQKPAW